MTSRRRQIGALQAYLRYSARAAIDPTDADQLEELQRVGVPRDLIDDAQTIASALHDTTDPDRPWTVHNRRADEVLEKFVNVIDARVEAKAGSSPVDVDELRDRNLGPRIVEGPNGLVLDLGPEGEVHSHTPERAPWAQ
jgi:hypothetical protein